MANMIYATQGGGTVEWDELQKSWRFIQRPEEFPDMEFMPD